MKDRRITLKSFGLFLFGVLLAIVLEVLGSDGSRPGIVFIIVLTFIAGTEVLLLLALGLYHLFKWYTIKRDVDKMPGINKFKLKQQEEYREISKTLLLCAGLILLLGLSFCLGGFYLFSEIL